MNPFERNFVRLTRLTSRISYGSLLVVLYAGLVELCPICSRSANAGRCVACQRWICFEHAWNPFPPQRKQWGEIERVTNPLPALSGQAWTDEQQEAVSKRRQQIEEFLHCVACASKLLMGVAVATTPAVKRKPLPTYLPERLALILPNIDGFTDAEIDAQGLGNGAGLETALQGWVPHAMSVLTTCYLRSDSAKRNTPDFHGLKIGQWNNSHEGLSGSSVFHELLCANGRIIHVQEDTYNPIFGLSRKRYHAIYDGTATLERLRVFLKWTQKITPEQHDQIIDRIRKSAETQRTDT
jgi:hypothetical protein